MTHPYGVPPLPYAQLRLIRQHPAAEVYSGVDQGGREVTVAVLTPAGAADPMVRAAFVELAGSNSYSIISGQIAVHAADLAAPRPWAANWRYPDRPGVEDWLTILPAPTAAPPPMPGPFPGPVSGPGLPPPMVPPPAVAGPVPPGVPVMPGGPVMPGAPGGGRFNRVAVAWAICIAVVLVAGGATIAVMLSGDHGTPRAKTSASASPSVRPQPEGSAGASGGPSATGSASPAITGTAEPALRQVTARSLIGPTFASGEETYTMAFPGWPFAFRTPKTWGCVAGKIDNMPDAKAWVCIDEQNTAAKQRVNIMIRRCPTTCTAAERTDMNATWLDAPNLAKAGFDDRTWYVETQADAEGNYTVDLSRYVPEAPGQAMKFQLGFSVKSPPATKATVQKIMNDILTQSP